ncbi:C1 family peptidase [Bifidobacterium oedipodis]|uniref:Aminopeptidase n=1 Tax=Bifidobacterium oedipodis TaxID=2675322 RepID=A0A7Y0HT81_9BIFI|nr:C1 family peptidase [Bifidobacterium sp. DSM 109957]NMM93842.1 aminopeptidase [Bifidobacterium sp. DSM 109957]
MTNDTQVQAVSSDQLKSYSTAFNQDRANLVAADAAVSAGVLKAATSYRGVRELPREFSVELKQGSITNQKHSGRCWMFASLNTLRYELMHTWNLEDFEFSETYLFFWDAIEKSNTYLEQVLATLDEPTDSRLFQIINDEPASDGGWWQMFVALVNKYGLCPKSAYPESANSEDSDAFKQYLGIKLREFAAELRRKHAAGATVDELRELKREQMSVVYRICAISLGEPPERFDWMARVSDDDKNDDAKKTDKSEKSDKSSKSGKDERKQIVEHGITPLEFAAKYVPVNVNDFVTLCNAPMAQTPFLKRYRIAYTANVVEAGDMEFVNVPLDVFKKAAVSQLAAGHPIWFACDCTQFSLRHEGFFDRSVVRADRLFGTEFTFDKADGLEYAERPSNHAMTLTGVNLDADGKPNRWKVENSWGKDNGKDGYYVASDDWFDRYVTEIIIRKDFLDEATRALTSAEPVELQPWQALTLASPCA